jgi:hypothetical protein
MDYLLGFVRFQKQLPCLPRLTLKRTGQGNKMIYQWVKWRFFACPVTPLSGGRYPLLRALFWRFRVFS